MIKPNQSDKAIPSNKPNQSNKTKQLSDAVFNNQLRNVFVNLLSDSELNPKFMRVLDETKFLDRQNMPKYVKLLSAPTNNKFVSLPTLKETVVELTGGLMEWAISQYKESLPVYGYRITIDGHLPKEMPGFKIAEVRINISNDEYDINQHTATVSTLKFKEDLTPYFKEKVGAIANSNTSDWTCAIQRYVISESNAMLWSFSAVDLMELAVWRIGSEKIVRFNLDDKNPSVWLFEKVSYNISELNAVVKSALAQIDALLIK